MWQRFIYLRERISGNIPDFPYFPSIKTTKHDFDRILEPNLPTLLNNKILTLERVVYPAGMPKEQSSRRETFIIQGLLYDRYGPQDL